MAARRGVLLFVLLITLLGSLVLYAALSRHKASPTGAVATVLVFKAPSSIDEGPPPYRPYSLDAFRWRGRPTVTEFVDAIDRAADDDHVKALVLHVDGIDWGWGRIAEVRDALLRFRASGKPLYASVTGGGDVEYLLASSATTISAPPTASLYVDGLTLSALFLKGTFDKIGVTPNFAHVGEYKSAVESYTRTDLSAPAREALDAVLDDDYATLVDSVASARRLSPDSVRALIDRGPFDATEARAGGLLDTLLYDAEVDTLAVRAVGGHPSTQQLSHYARDIMPARFGTHVALVTAEGAIAGGKSRTSPGGGITLGAETLIEALRDVRHRRSIKAVILRIDSPGGDAEASDEIWREVERLRRVKPVIVSMSDYAASGGYYIAMGANAIVAQPGTLTGSIGIFGGKFNLLGLYRKLGLNVETLSRGKHAEMMSMYRDFTPEEAEHFQEHLESFYRGFVAKVAANRGRSDAEIDSLARGRVWSGEAAFQRGLVDTLGGMDAALALVRRHAHLGADETIVLDRYPIVERPFFQQMLESLWGDENDDDDAALKLLLEPVTRTWAAVAEMPPGRALAILPYSIRIR